MIFRRAVKEDSPAVNDLFIQMIQTANERMRREGVELYTEPEKGFEDGYLDKFYVDDENVIFAAEINGRVIGFLSINSYREEGYLYLDDYRVSEE